MYIVPAVIIVTIIVSLVKRVDVYKGFVNGIDGSLRLSVKLLPYLISVFMLIRIFRASGLSTALGGVLATPFSWLGIPKELIELMVLRPLSGSGSLAVVESIFAEYGADSYVGRCASVLMASNDTILYIVSVYFAECEDKKSGAAIPIAFAAYIFGTVLTCFICRYL